MDHPAIMSVRECRGELAPVVEDCFCGQCPLPDKLSEGTAFHIFHGNERLAGIFSHFVNGADVRMIQRRSRSGLTLQAFLGSRTIRPFFKKELQGYGAKQSCVLSAVNNSHPSAAKRTEN